jgi:hypothetical protein
MVRRLASAHYSARITGLLEEVLVLKRRGK